MLFCGINPSLYSAATGWHFARPGNRFWPALHLSGFTPRRLAPHEQHLLPGYGLGITNLVARATAQASELDAAELRVGGERLLALLTGHRPGILAIAGVTAYRSAFGHARAGIGPQPDPLGGSRVWVLPNPSGLNAQWTLGAIAAQFAAMRSAVSPEDQTHLSRTSQVPARASPQPTPRTRARIRRSARDGNDHDVTSLFPGVTMEHRGRAARLRRPRPYRRRASGGAPGLGFPG